MPLLCLFFSCKMATISLRIAATKLTTTMMICATKKGSMDYSYWVGYWSTSAPTTGVLTLRVYGKGNSAIIRT